MGPSSTPRSICHLFKRSSYMCSLHLSACMCQAVSLKGVAISTSRSGAMINPAGAAQMQQTCLPCASCGRVSTSLGWMRRLWRSPACREIAMRDALATALLCGSSAMLYAERHARLGITARPAAPRRHPARLAGSILREVEWILAHASNARQVLVARKQPSRPTRALPIPSTRDSGRPSALSSVGPRRSAQRARLRRAGTPHAAQVSIAQRASA